MADTKPPAWRAPAPAVVLLSGGLDSATALAIARRDGFAPLALSFRYGQRHASEIDAARAVAAAGGVVEHRIIDIDLRVFGGSALTADIAVPKDRPLAAIHSAAASGRGERASGAFSAGEGVSGASGKGDDAFGSSGDGGGVCGPLGEGERASGSSGGRERQPDAAAAPIDVPITYVPARNTIFLSYALALAEVRGAADIFVGVNAVDYSGYPDCRPEYIRAFERLAALATRAGVSGRPTRIHAPLIDLSKAEIIRRGLALGVDYGLTRSCYDPDAAGRGCRRCDSCRLRLAAFSEIGIADPAPYA